MTILLPALAVALAAFCIWLTVRIANRRERWTILVAVYVMPTILALAWARAFYWWSHR